MIDSAPLFARGFSAALLGICFSQNPAATVSLLQICFFFFSPPLRCINSQRGAWSQRSINYSCRADVRRHCCATAHRKSILGIDSEEKAQVYMGLLVLFTGFFFPPLALWLIKEKVEENPEDERRRCDYLCRRCCKRLNSAPSRCRTPSRRRCWGSWEKRGRRPCRYSSASSVP